MDELLDTAFGSPSRSPLFVWALVRALSVPTDLAVGLLLVGFASAGPLGIKAAALAGADVAYAITLVVVLEAANALVIPAVPLALSVVLGRRLASIATGRRSRASRRCVGLRGKAIGPG
jgi:predicted Na+-dependent transporter